MEIPGTRHLRDKDFTSKVIRAISDLAREINKPLKLNTGLDRYYLKAWRSYLVLVAQFVFVPLQISIKLSNWAKEKIQL